MKKIAACACLAWAGLGFLPQTAGLAQAATPIQHWTQPGGAQVYLVPSPGIPMLDVQLDFDAGDRRDPAAQAGLAGVTAMMAGKGVAAQGTAPALDENRLGEAWADLGASFGADAGTDRMSFRLRTLTDPALLKANLVHQLTSPVLWAKGMKKLVDHGYENFIELGPGNVLAGLLKRVARKANRVSIGKADELAGAVAE